MPVPARRAENFVDNWRRPVRCNWVSVRALRRNAGNCKSANRRGGYYECDPLFGGAPQLQVTRSWNTPAMHKDSCARRFLNGACVRTSTIASVRNIKRTSARVTRKCYVHKTETGT